MPPECARSLLDWRASKDVPAHIEELRTKADAGNTSGDEELEYTEFVEAVDIISLLQSKAMEILSARQ